MAKINLTPKKIYEQEFKTSIRGYDKTEVDGSLVALAYAGRLAGADVALAFSFAFSSCNFRIIAWLQVFHEESPC